MTWLLLVQPQPVTHSVSLHTIHSHFTTVEVARACAHTYALVDWVLVKKAQTPTKALLSVCSWLRRWPPPWNQTWANWAKWGWPSWMQRRQHSRCWPRVRHSHLPVILVQPPR